MKNIKETLSKHKTGAVLATAVLLLSGVWIYHDNTNLGTTRYDVLSSNLPEAFDGFVIAQISDLHNTLFGENQEELKTALIQAKPDIIVFTGDLIDSRRTDVNIAIELIHQAVKVAPVYYVTGNHESRVEGAFQRLNEEMLACGVHVLQNDFEILQSGGQSIRLIGLNDPTFSVKQKSESFFVSESAQKLAGLTTEDAFTILLSHRPELFETYRSFNIDLVFCGHVHGGQVRLPLLGGLLAPNQGFFPKYDAGYFKEGSTSMIVSRGLGNSLFPFRVNNPPELVVVTLKKSNS